MTWKYFVDLSTLEHRSLFAAYAAVVALQGAYVGWVLRGLGRPKAPKPTR